MEMNDKICEQVISILIKPRSNLVMLFLNCWKSELVQSDTGTEKRVHHWTRAYAFELNGPLP